MGKNAKLRKLAKLTTERQEEQLIAERQKKLRRPTLIMARRLTITLLGTVLLLTIGVVVNHRLGEILTRLR